MVGTFLGFRECSVAGAEMLTARLAGDVCSRERQAQRVHEEQIEEPSRIRIGRMMGQRCSSRRKR